MIRLDTDLIIDSRIHRAFMDSDSISQPLVPSDPFEGAEKLLEIWFAPSSDCVPGVHASQKGLRAVPRKSWEDMLQIVKCKIISVVQGIEMDAYLLSESSLFISPHRIILKTCGTTLNLLGLPRILEIAANEANMHNVYNVFYSHKSFMSPERQLGPHKDWKQEVEYLDRFFKNGAGYTIGKVNGDHWLLYIASPDDESTDDTGQHAHHGRPLDYTVEVLMRDLSPKASKSFFSGNSFPDDPTLYGLEMSQKTGIADLFPPSLTTLDAYAFTPCGYSSNALIQLDTDCLNHNPGIDVRQIEKPSHTHSTHIAEGYYTIHVTPEEGWSFASFECNIPLPASSESIQQDKIPDLKSLVKRLVNIFEPGRITVTLFISKNHDSTIEFTENPIEAAQQAIRVALGSVGKENGLDKVYKRVDKISYEFDSYDLAFASFECK